jgi:O2-independent ubiquinone biosynthesis protein UbiU
MKVSVVAPLNSVNHLDAILESGANEVYFGLQGSLNSRNFSNLNIALDDLPFVLKKCHSNDVKANLVMNSFPSSVKALHSNESTIKKSSSLGVDSIITASFSVMGLIKKIDPLMPIHVSVMAAISNPESINFLASKFNIQRAVQAPDKSLNETKQFIHSLNKDISLEIISFGTLSVGFQGNCNLSKFISGVETNTQGVCSHPKFLSSKKIGNSSKLYFKDIMVEDLDTCGECDLTCLKKDTGENLLKKEKGHGWKNTALVNKRYVCRGSYVIGEKKVKFQNYEYLNVLPLCQELIDIGVKAFKIEGRQRPPEYAIKTSKLFSDSINNGKYSKNKLIEVEKEFFPGMKPFAGGLNYA